MSPAPLRVWSAEPLAAPVAAALDVLARSEDVVHVAAMPDVHWAEGVCVGVAVATERLIYPQAVGSDIGCGVAAVRFDLGAEALIEERAAAAVLSGLIGAVPARKQRRATVRSALPEGLAERPLSHPSLEKLKHRDGLWEFGTLGRGNHFIELQSDDDGALWAMVHSGSRAVGPAILAHHLAAAGPPARGLVAFAAESPAGEAWLADGAWAMDYAAANRQVLIDAVAAVLRRVFGAAADIGSFVTCHHNHVRRERHLGRELFVHRKGAIPAGAGEPGLIPGSMGAPSFHVSGRGCAEALASSSHGAGRALSRSEARQKIPLRRLIAEMRGVWFDHRRAGALRDEAPSAYKDIGAVMRAQRELTVIVRRVRPVLSFKGT